MGAQELETETQFPGGKGHSFRTLINLMPPHDRYVESHLGGGAVMRHKLQARENIGIDLDGRVVARWRRRAPEGITVLHGCALKLLPTLSLGPRDLVYSDPPYLPATRRTPRYYRHECGEDQHRRLLETLRGLEAMVILSGYRHSLYDELLCDWTQIEYQAQTHNGVVTEIAWLNFAPGPLLHDYRYLGDGYRDRERIRRRTTTLAKRLVSAPDVELNAALANLAVKRPEAVRAAADRLEP